MPHNAPSTKIGYQSFSFKHCVGTTTESRKREPETPKNTKPYFKNNEDCSNLFEQTQRLNQSISSSPELLYEAVCKCFGIYTCKL